MKQFISDVLLHRNSIVAILAFGAISACSPALFGAEKAGPNIVLIVADDMGYSDVGAFGCKDIKTPNIDRLAEAGTLFTDAYVTGPICVPSRAGFMTGRCQERWGIYGNGDGYTPKGLRGMAAETTVAEIFQQAGYATALIGKWHLHGNGALHKSPPFTLPENNGFDEVCVIQGGMSYYNSGTSLYCGGGRVEKSPEYLTDHFGKLSVDFIDRNKDKPFFLCLTFNAPHAPLQAPADDVAQYGEIPVVDRRTYAGMVAAIDRNVGRVLDALAAAGVEKNTIVAFFSDNGGPAHDAPSHSRNMADNGPLRGHKFDVLEGGIRTPLIMRWPGKIASVRKFAGLTSTMDLGATFLAASCLTAPPEKPLDGVNLMPYLGGQKKGAPHSSLFWECTWYANPDCAARRGPWKIVQLRTGPEGPVASQWQLFNLVDDIGEANDVAADHPEIVKELDGAFRDWRSRMIDPLYRHKPAAIGSRSQAAKISGNPNTKGNRQ